MIHTEADHEHSTAVTTPPPGIYLDSMDPRDTPIDSTVVGNRPADAETSTAQRGLGGRRPRVNTRGILLALLSAPPAAMATCLSLKGSKACSAFQASSVSTTDAHVVGLLYVNQRCSLIPPWTPN